jgi:5-enolpyruvylshikimate-3-phosphate synthase
MTFYIDRSPFLHEGYVKRAAVVTNLNSYGIEIEFDHQGALVLDSVSTSYKSRHIAIFSDFSPAQKRWLAAPLVNNRITNGVLNFTPDASREEAERIVRGLNNVAGKWQKRK